MDRGGLAKFLGRFADIRRDEAKSALYLFLYFFLITFAFYIIKAVKENFLIGFHPNVWSYADLITAALIGFVVALNARLLNRLARRKYVSNTLIFFVLNLVLFWFVFWLNTQRKFLISSLLVLAQDNRVHLGAMLVLSFWTDIFIVMSITQFWINVNDCFNPHQVKRLIGFLVTGGLLGGIGGSLLTLGLVRVIGPVNLMLICPGVLLLTLFIVNLLHNEKEKIREGLGPDPAGSAAGIGYFESFRSVLGDRYLRLLAGVLASAMIVGQLVKYQFNFIVKVRYVTENERTTFLASFFLAVLFLSTIFHLATTGQVLKRFGIRLALLIAPSALLIGTLAAFLIPTAGFAGLLAWAYCMRGTERIFDTTLSQSVRELLYIPIRPEIKYKAKIFIDMFVNKFSSGLGAALYLLFSNVLSFKYYQEHNPGVPIRDLGYLVIGFAVLWVVLIMIIYAEYLSTVMKDLKRKWEDAHRIIHQHVDVDAARLVVDTIESREKSSTLYLMNLFDLVQKEKLTPELTEILDARENELKANSMDSLLGVGGEAFYPGIQEDIADRDFMTQIREILALDSFKEVMGTRLAEMVGKSTVSERERMEAAKLIGLMESSPGIFGPLGRLLLDPSPDVRNYALGSAAIHLRKEHVPLIIPLLGNQATQQVAQGTLAAYGPRIEDALKDHLQDREERLEVRKAIPEVLARLQGSRAADILTEELSRGDEAMEQELIEALYKIRTDQPEVRFKEKKILAAAVSLAKKSAASVLARAEAATAGDPAGQASDRDALLDLRIKRIFDLLALVYPSEDIVKAYQNICRGTKKSVDYSLELLDNILDTRLKAVLFPLVEDLPVEERTRRLKKALRGLRKVSPHRRLKKDRRVV